MVVLRVSTVLGTLSCAALVFAQGLNAGLQVSHISVALTDAAILQNQASMNFDVTNTMPTSVTITSMSAVIGILGNPILSFDQAFPSFVVPASGTANSGTIPNATLTEGALSLLQIILLPDLDIINADMTLSMQQIGIPVNFTLNLT
ncbi:hypothetical protein EW145_g948 [Phellinidium pouzarii]|uniref:Late embryogenesis abundant protein LEA-2 subgroup domain-containing protein n=1 Tax=Phellinidium pouzarii TaxID=167371 RepID=A0A4S4LGE5_9AGAM|nr:hypothetical protein EW145_g948 [Phellinidium pouzarii]